jgi:hypothetical protein
VTRQASEALLGEVTSAEDLNRVAKLGQQEDQALSVQGLAEWSDALETENRS